MPEDCSCQQKSSDPRLLQGSLLASVKADSRGWDWDTPGGWGLCSSLSGVVAELLQKVLEDVALEGWLLHQAEGIRP